MKTLYLRFQDLILMAPTPQQWKMCVLVWQKTVFTFTFTLEYGKESPKKMSIYQ